VPPQRRSRLAPLAGTAHADPTIDIPRSDEGDHDPYPVLVALKKWDPDSSISLTQAQNNAVLYCSLRQAGHSEDWIVSQFADGDSATFRPVIQASEQHFCSDYAR
jgi:hypothetical protein